MNTAMTDDLEERPSIAIAFAKVFGLTIVAWVAIDAFIPAATAGEFSWAALAKLAAVSAAFLLVALRASRGPWRTSLRLERAHTGHATTAAVVAGTLALSLFGGALAQLIAPQAANVLSTASGSLRPSTAAQMLALGVVFGPLTAFGEEAFFRGFVQGELARRWPVARALAVTSFIFAVMHLSGARAPALLGVGLWLGLVTERSGSIQPGIWAHTANNLVVVAAALSAEQVEPGRGEVMWALLLGAPVFAAAATFFLRTSKAASAGHAARKPPSTASGVPVT